MDRKRVPARTLALLAVLLGGPLLAVGAGVRPAVAASYHYPVDLSPDGPNAAGAVTVTTRSDPTDAEYGPRLEYVISGTYTRICPNESPSCTVFGNTVGATGNSGRTTWTFTIPQQSAGTMVEFQLFNDGSAGPGDFYGWTGFNWGYYVDGDSQSYHTPYIDGLLDFHTGEQLGSAGGVTYYLAWDDTYLYVGFAGGDASSSRYNVFLDVNPTGNTGATATFAGTNFPANGAPDYAVQWQSGSNAFYFATGSGGVWTAGATTDLLGDDNNNDGGTAQVDLRILRSKVGLGGTSTAFAVYLTVANSSDDCWSAFPTNNTTGANPDDLTTAHYSYASKDVTTPATAGLNAPFSGLAYHAGDGSYLWTDHTFQRKVVYANDRWWVVYRNGGGGNIRARSSSDNGVTWSTEINVTSGSAINRAPTLLADGTTLRLAWLNSTDNAFYYNTIDMTSSTVGTRRTIASAAFDGSEAVALAQGSDGTLWAAISLGSIYRSTDGGTTWAQSPNPPANLTDLGGTGNSYNNAAILLALPNGRMMAIQAQTDRNYSYSIWDGTAGWTEWAAIHPMDNEGVAGRNAECSAVVDQAGNVYFDHVADTGTSTGTPDTVRVYKYTTAAGTWAQQPLVTVSGADTIHFPALALNGDDVLYLAYRQANNDTSDFRLYWRTSTDGAATWGTPTQVGYTSATLRTFFEVGLNRVSDRFLAVVYRHDNPPNTPLTPRVVLVDIFTAPRVPVQLAPYDSGELATATPALSFSSVDPGRDDVRYNVQIDDEPTFAAPLVADATSGTSAGFANLTTPADTDPFNSGDTVQYTVQSSLTQNKTYYWRVRALDPSPGSTYWSGWSPVRAFDYFDSALNVWHQGGLGQFAHWDRRANAVAGADDRVRAGARSVIAVSAADDDAFDDGANKFPNDSVLRFGHLMSVNETSGMIFRAVPVQTAESPYVDVATVQLVSPATQSYPGPVTVRVEAEDDADGVIANFGGTNTRPSARAVGTAVADWTVSSAWGAGAVVNTPELRGLVQEVVQRSGWDSGDDVDIIIRNNGSASNNHHYAISQDGGTPPRLYVTYVSNTANGAVYSPPIVYNGTVGSGGYGWGEVYWHEWEPGAANVRVRVYYRQSDGTMAIVPDAALPGNSAGFDQGFVDISALSTASYGTLYLVAGLTVDTAAASPSLYWWSVGERYDPAGTSTLAVPFAVNTADLNHLYTPRETGIRLYFTDMPDSDCTITGEVRRNQLPTNAGLPSPVRRYYEITPSGCTNYAATLVLGYTTDSLVGNVEANLHAWRWSGASWVDMGGTVDVNANTVTVSGVTAFSQWALDDQSPTAVRLASFAAWPAASGVLLSWETASEDGNVGFNVYRSATPDAAGERVNEALIPSRVPGGGQGASYTWLDTAALPGMTYSYTLEDVDVSGWRTAHGPVTATLWRVYLPVVER